MTAKKDDLKNTIYALSTMIRIMDHRAGGTKIQMWIPHEWGIRDKDGFVIAADLCDYAVKVANK